MENKDNAELPKELLDLDLINSKLVHALKQLQLNRIRAEIELHQKVHDLHADYQEKLGEFDLKRAKIISGEYVPTEEETKYEFVDENFPPPSDIKDKGIPHFWPIIFHNLDILSEMIQETDEPLLNHLVDVRSVLLKEPRGFKLEFEFSENEWFSNKVLTKEYFYSDKVDPFEPLQNEGLIIERAVGCTIDWKSPEKNLTMKKVSKKLKHKADNTVKSVEKMEKVDSFFNFFEPPTESLENADEDTRELLVSDFDIGETLRQSVIPRAVIYFTGEGIEDDDDYDEDMDEEDFDEFDEDDDEEDDDDEDDEGDDDASPSKKGSDKQPASKSSKSRGGKHGHGEGVVKRGAKKDVPQECKQQ